MAYSKENCRQFMKKKAVQVELKTLILVVIIAIVLFIFVSRMVDYFKKVNYEEFCRLNVIAAAKTKVVGKQLISLECEMQRTKIEKETDDEIKQTIADSLVSCWKIFGQGNLTPFNQNIADFKLRNACFICRKITFDESLKNEDYKVIGFDEWLKENDLPRTNTKYIDYLSHKLEKEERIVPFIFRKKEVNTFEPPTMLDSKKEYYITYFAALPGFLSENFQIAGIKFAGTEAVPILAIVPSDEFDALGCDKIYN